MPRCLCYTENMVSEFRIDIEQEQIIVNIVRSKRRSMSIEIRTDGAVYARVPNRISDRMVKRFITNHARWIYEKRLAMFARKKEIPNCPYDFPEWETMSPQEKKQAKEKIIARVENYAGIMGITYGTVTMRNQKSRWGSCSSKGNLNFNYRLAYLPQELLDYVVVHELAHRRHMDHSKEFWNEVGRYYPKYKRYKNLLEKIII